MTEWPGPQVRLLRNLLGRRCQTAEEGQLEKSLTRTGYGRVECLVEIDLVALEGM